MSNEKVYYPGLNGIRAIAAFIVLIFHIDLTSYLFGIPELGFHKNGMAGYGVILFFVLSGFLITSLLLKEKELTNNISIGNFYLRRILRIWPLYYFALFIGLFIALFVDHFQGSHITKTMLFYTFFLPNVAFELKIAFASIAPLWSVGVEEQFYAMWPWIIRKSKNVLRSLIIIIIIYLTIKLIARFSGSHFFYNLVYISAFDCMAIGGIGAYLLHTKSKLLKIAFHPFTQIVSWSVLFVSLIIKPIHFTSFLDQEINSVFYLILILNVSSNSKTLISLENRVFDYLGKISYGIYVYHFIVITILSMFLKNVLGQGIMANILLYLIVIGTTVLVASISYKYFESRFLRLRHKFTIVESKNSRYQ